MELQEAAQIHQGLQPAAAVAAAVGRPAPPSLYDMRAIVKTWRNRLPVLSDDLSHWSDIFTWRQHHYQLPISPEPTICFVSKADAEAGKEALITTTELHFCASLFRLPITACEVKPSSGSPSSAAAAMCTALGTNAATTGKVASPAGPRSVSCFMSCSGGTRRIHTIPSVPIVDCFQKIRQQVKCYLQMSNVTGKNELQEGLDVIESTNLKYFAKDMTAEFYALKGLFLAQMGRSEEANKALSAAVQMHDTLVKAWALWGDYLEGLFGRDRWESRQLNLAASALTCFLHACRHQNEPKARKYLAKVLWLLTYDNEQGTLAEAVDKYNAGVPPLQWLPWVPQLLTCLVRPEGRLLLNLLVQMVWFRENWYEEVLRQLRQGLGKCYAVAFENRGAVADATVTPHTLNFLKKLVSTFGVGIENVSSVTTTFSSAASESLARRAQATAQDPVFQKMKGQFSTDFDFASILIEDKCRFLSNFSQQTADIALPGEFLLPKRCGQRGVEHDAPVGRYYERLAAVQARGSQASHQVLRDILKDVQATMVPRTLLRDWALATFQAPTHYWTFRKQVGFFHGALDWAGI
ncbi:hypothetical protein V5799_009908 [Amblyomma americanum]|uniref:FAT domain-containing protein n=1 Tax=Amblyomma americanum TaxID=6943 RepID=A0AAQ4F954_AMBAM